MTSVENLVPPYAEVAPNELEGGCSAGEQSLEEECTLVPGPLSPYVAPSSLSQEMFPNNTPPNSQQNTSNVFSAHPSRDAQILCSWRMENFRCGLALLFKVLLWGISSLVQTGWPVFLPIWADLWVRDPTCLQFTKASPKTWGCWHL